MNRRAPISGICFQALTSERGHLPLAVGQRFKLGGLGLHPLRLLIVSRNARDQIGRQRPVEPDLACVNLVDSLFRSSSAACPLDTIPMAPRRTARQCTSELLTPVVSISTRAWLPAADNSSGRIPKPLSGKSRSRSSRITLGFTKGRYHQGFVAAPGFPHHRQTRRT